MYNVYWIHRGRRKQKFCVSKQERELVIEKLIRAGIACGWERV